MPDSPTTQTGFAIYTGEACSGVQLGEVLLNDALPPPAGSLTTQCVYVAPGPPPPGPQAPSFAGSCQHARSLRTSTPTNPAPFPCF
jgi:hypothetical protein